MNYSQEDSIQIDHEGKFKYLGEEIPDPIPKLFFADNQLYIDWHDKKILEIYDQAIVVESFENGKIQFQGIEEKLNWQILYLDEWDRIHSFTRDHYPLVFSNHAQEQLFDALDSFDDDSFVYQGNTYTTKSFYPTDFDARKPDFWTRKYEESESPGFDLGMPHPALEDIEKTLKLPKSKIAVLGCGSGHDAAFWANQGHIVHAFDFSENAIALAKEKYPETEHLQFHQTDVFQLGQEHHEAYDIVFDHTLYCAVPPVQRAELVKQWLKLLRPSGKLIGIFFQMRKMGGPPYGGSQWELQQRTKKKFRTLYWQYYRNSPGWRKGLEFIAVLEKMG